MLDEEIRTANLALVRALEQLTQPGNALRQETRRQLGSR